jgi:hypothetical protein
VAHASEDSPTTVFFFFDSKNLFFDEGREGGMQGGRTSSAQRSFIFDNWASIASLSSVSRLCWKGNGGRRKECEGKKVGEGS